MKTKFLILCMAVFYAISINSQNKIFLPETDDYPVPSSKMAANVILGDDWLCASSYYRVQDLNASTQVTWTVSGDLRISSGQGTNNVLIAAAYVNGTGLGTIKATLPDGSTLSKSVWVISPGVTSIGGADHASLDMVYYYTAEPYYATFWPDRIDFEWTIEGPNAESRQEPDKRSLRVVFKSRGTYILTCRSKTSCGYQLGSAARLKVEVP